MKKVILCAALLLAISSQIFAQDSGTGKFSLGLDGGLPVGASTTTYKLVIGGDLKYSIPVAQNVSVSLSAGYSDLIGKKFNGTIVVEGLATPLVIPFGIKFNNLGVIPIKFGVRYSANHNYTGFFAEAQLGAAFLTQGSGGTAFAYSPGMGYAFKDGLEAGLSYEGWTKSSSTFGQVALRFAYTF